MKNKFQKNCVSKIGILGGTFDPIHYGHLSIAETACLEYELEKIIFIPSGQPPHKTAMPVSSSEHRYFMTAIATAGNPKFYTSDIEIKRNGITYTIDTIKELQSTYKYTDIYFIVGIDAISLIDTWKEWDKLFDICKFIVVSRPNYDNKIALSKIPPKFIDKINFLKVVPVNTSSTKIRRQISEKKTVKYLIPDLVLDYITKYNLYENYILIQKIYDFLNANLSEKRYKHTLGVAEEAINLANFYGYDSKKAYICGLIHDCAKELRPDEVKKYFKKYGLKMEVLFKKIPEVVHGYLAAEIAKNEFGIKEEDMLNAISYHTTGRPNMSLLGKIIYLADMIEVNRPNIDEINNIRFLAYRNMEEAVYESLKYTISFLERKQREIHPLSLKSLEYFESKKNN